MTGPETSAATQDDTMEVAPGDTPAMTLGESDATSLVEDVSIDGMCGVY